jgi:hypothetical protein
LVLKFKDSNKNMSILHPTSLDQFNITDIFWLTVHHSPYKSLSSSFMVTSTWALPNSVTTISVFPSHLCFYLSRKIPNNFLSAFLRPHSCYIPSQCYQLIIITVLETQRCFSVPHYSSYPGPNIFSAFLINFVALEWETELQSHKLITWPCWEGTVAQLVLCATWRFTRAHTYKQWSN